jgi:hypothetical protein
MFDQMQVTLERMKSEIRYWPAGIFPWD